jgi:hypothetical protein
MKQKKIFKRRQKRQTLKRTLVTAGLLALSFASFSAGVQFAEITSSGVETHFAETSPELGVETGVIVPLQVAHSVGHEF